MTAVANLQELLSELQSDAPDRRMAAWLRADQAGPAAVKPLARLMSTGALEVSRAARHALWTITHAAGAPNSTQRAAVCRELTALLVSQVDESVRREVLWMLSHLDHGPAIPQVARLLDHRALRGDACQVLERLGHRYEPAVAALHAAWKTAPDDFKPVLAQSLRSCGQTVPGTPCEKLVPRRATEVKPIG